MWGELSDMVSAIPAQHKAGTPYIGLTEFRKALTGSMSPLFPYVPIRPTGIPTLASNRMEVLMPSTRATPPAAAC